jgi:hypothetical protein
MLVSEEGITIVVNDEQPKKAESPMLVTEEGFSSSIAVNNEHS